LQQGPGVGGHCIAVDPWFLVDAAPEQARLIHTARVVNDYKPGYIVEKIVDRAKRITSPVIACLGLAFKANVDDLRESPALEIVEHLAKLEVGSILVVEPHIQALPERLQLEHVQLKTTEEAIRMADLVVLLVNHDVFYAIDRDALQEKIVIDTRGFFSELSRVRVGV
jgi:UDP-N-acetyl-D-mannosaminuronic acid dehydrogenase